MIEYIGISVAAAIGTLLSLVILAWFTILPAIGVLYLAGYMR